jgi:MFS family permease
VLPTSRPPLDPIGIGLSLFGVFAVVFGVQQGQVYHWGAGIVGFIVGGIALIAGFVFWEARRPGRALLPLDLFRNRNFSVATLAITTVGFAVSGMGIPLMLWAQEVEGLSPLRSALLLVPMAAIAALLAPLVGKLVDRTHPRTIAAAGLGTFALALLWAAAVLGPHISIATLLPPLCLMGVANACIWAPISASATRTLAPDRAGAGSGVYNTARQVGGVLGSAGIAALLQSRLSAELGHGTDLAAATSRALAQTLVLPGVVLLVGLVTVLFFAETE